MGGLAVTSLVFVTQVIDPDDPVLGFVTDWVRALGERVDRLTVIANEVRATPDLGTAVRLRSLGKEGGAGRLERGARFERILSEEVRRPRPGAVIAHMCPVYVNLGAPIAKAAGVPTLLWFAHPAVTPALRLAVRLSDAVLTSLPSAFPLPGDKVHVIGQATDLAAFPFDPPAAHEGPLRVLALGRTSPAKGFDVLVAAARRLAETDLRVQVRIVGPSTTQQERRHREELRTAIARAGPATDVALEPGVPPAGVPDVIRDADVLVNTMVAGSGDKVVFQAAAMGRLPIVSNPAFEPLLHGLEVDLLFPEGDDAALADRLRTVADVPAAERARTARTIRERIEKGHSLDHWADEVVAAVRRARRGRRADAS